MAKRRIEPDPPSPLLLKPVILDCEISCRMDRFLGLDTACGIKVDGAQDIPRRLDDFSRRVPLIITTVGGICRALYRPVLAFLDMGFLLLPAQSGELLPSAALAVTDPP